MPPVRSPWMTPWLCRNAIADAISDAVVRMTGALGGASTVGRSLNHPLSTASCACIHGKPRPSAIAAGPADTSLVRIWAAVHAMAQHAATPAKECKDRIIRFRRHSTAQKLTLPVTVDGKVQAHTSIQAELQCGEGTRLHGALVAVLQQQPQLGDLVRRRLLVLPVRAVRGRARARPVGAPGGPPAGAQAAQVRAAGAQLRRDHLVRVQLQSSRHCASRTAPAAAIRPGAQALASVRGVGEREINIAQVLQSHPQCVPHMGVLKVQV